MEQEFVYELPDNKDGEHIKLWLEADNKSVKLMGFSTDKLDRITIATLRQDGVIMVDGENVSSIGLIRR